MKNQDMLMWALFLVALWLLFFRKSDGFCAACAVPVAIAG